MRDPDALLARAGVTGDPRRDQHFLVDDRVLDRLPTYLPDEARKAHLLEVGPGTGALTDRLLTIGDRVTVVERDPELVAFLREEFREERARNALEIIQGDALEVDLPSFTASVSNLPYGVSSEIAFRLFPENQPLVLTFQREFAERMVASAGTSEYGRLSVTAQHYAGVEIVETIPKEAFSPAPTVQSAVIRATPRDPDYDVADEAFFFDFVKALFTQRRKTVRNAIRNTAHISNLDDASGVVAAADEALLSRRPDDLEPEEFASLASLAVEVGVDA
ncbi:MAG: 16S rRNA (adenine1518-N6/adenine1519-N6)-dimethyltransferase [Halobacteriales archaeon]|jgi:16S rRNA (adenine1518-N6/adenine1519-N6)-dimethyltransferase